MLFHLKAQAFRLHCWRLAARAAGLDHAVFPTGLQVLDADSDRRPACCGQGLLLKLLGSKVVAHVAAPVRILLAQGAAGVIHRTGQVPAVTWVLQLVSCWVSFKSSLARRHGLKREQMQQQQMSWRRQ